MDNDEAELKAFLSEQIFKCTFLLPHLRILLETYSLGSYKSTCMQIANLENEVAGIIKQLETKVKESEVSDKK
jgi:hypothetical protein